jgi:hypothetical protein
MILQVVGGAEAEGDAMSGRRFVIPLVVVASVAAGGIAGAVLGVPGLSGASTTSSTPSSVPSHGPGKGGLPGFRARGGGDEIAAAAKALGLTPEELMQQLSDGKTTIADIAHQKNIPLDDVVNAMANADRDRIEQFVNNPLPQFGKDGPAAGGPPAGGPGAGFGPLGILGGANSAFAAAAKDLGITTQQLLSDIRNGQSIADVAKTKSVNIDTVINDMVAAAQKQIDDAVTAKKLTSEQAAKLSVNLKDRITKLVNGKLGGMGKGGFGFGGRAHGFGGPPPGAPAPSTQAPG